MECTETLEVPIISREVEARMYKFLQRVCEDDSLRYELIAKKVQRAADGVASDWDKGIVKDWLNAMLEQEVLAQQPQPLPLRADQWVAVRAGAVGNAFYQAFLDTLEQHELDTINSNVPFFEWISKRQAEMPASGVFGIDYLRAYADRHLSQRVKALRGLV